MERKKLIEILRKVLTFKFKIRWECITDYIRIKLYTEDGRLLSKWLEISDNVVFVCERTENGGYVLVRFYAISSYEEFLDKEFFIKFNHGG